MFSYETAVEYAKVQEQITGIPHYVFKTKPKRSSETGQVETLFEVVVIAY